MDWQPIETVPKDGSEVLIHTGWDAPDHPGHRVRWEAQRPATGNWHGGWFGDRGYLIFGGDSPLPPRWRRP